MKAYRFLLIAGVMMLILAACQPIKTSQEEQLRSTMAAMENQLATLSAGQAAPNPPVGNPAPITEPTVESLPTEPVPAGIPVVYDGWALTLSQEVTTGEFNDEQNFSLSFTVRNLGETTRVFRYVQSGMTVADNLGNVYEFSMVNSDCKKSPDVIHLTQQLTIDGKEKTNIYCSDWYACSGGKYLPPLKGVISLQATRLIVTINDWGPFNGVVFHLDL